MIQDTMQVVKDTVQVAQDSGFDIGEFAKYLVTGIVALVVGYFTGKKKEQSKTEL